MYVMSFKSLIRGSNTKGLDGLLGTQALDSEGLDSKVEELNSQHSEKASSKEDRRKNEGTLSQVQAEYRKRTSNVGVYMANCPWKNNKNTC